MKETKTDPPHTSGADPSPERVNPRSGLRRLSDAMRHILKVPKEAIEDEWRTPPSKTPD